MGRTVITITLRRDRSDQKWGFGITGGKDVGLTSRIEKVVLASPAGAGGLNHHDYLVKVAGKEVFELKHNEVVDLIKNAGNELEVVVERAAGDDDVVVPSFDMLYPKQKIDSNDYFQEAMRTGINSDVPQPGCFTSIGKPRVKTNSKNASINLYSEDVILEMAGGGGHGFVDESKLAPDCCPAARNKKRFDPSKSSTLGAILAQEQGHFEVPGVGLN